MERPLGAVQRSTNQMQRRKSSLPLPPAILLGQQQHKILSKPSAEQLWGRIARISLVQKYYTGVIATHRGDAKAAVVIAIADDEAVNVVVPEVCPSPSFSYSLGIYSSSRSRRD